MKYILKDIKLFQNNFSIIISLYNKFNYIERAILSVIKQNYKNYELIIIDASSTDGSFEIAIKYANCNKNIKVIRQINYGYSYSKNYGASIASYENITFLDADDEWNRDFLKEINFLINTYPDAKAYITGHNQIIDFNNIHSVIYKNVNSTGYISDYLNSRVKGWAPHTSSTVYNKKCFMKSGGFPSTVFSNLEKMSWLINSNEDIIATFKWLCPGQRSVELIKSIFPLPSTLSTIKDISIELPGCPAEDQFIFDYFGLNFHFAYSQKNLSNYYLNIPDQTIARIKNKKYGRFYPNLIQLNKYLEEYKAIDSVKYIKLNRYYRFMTIGLFSELINNAELRKLINSNYNLFEKWGSRTYPFALLNLIGVRLKRKFKFIVTNVFNKII